MHATANIKDLIDMRNVLLVNQQELYLSAIANMNMRYRELLKNDFGSTLVKNIAWDVADKIVNEYFDTEEY